MKHPINEATDETKKAVLSKPHRASAVMSPAAASASQTNWDSPSAAGFYDAYSAFARTLRTWLVGFGVGVPVVVASQENLAARLTESGSAGWVIGLFLAGVVIQVAAALMYKSAMWYAYVGAAEPSFCSTRRYRAASAIGDYYWLELATDVVTIGLFVAATFALLRAVL